MLHKVIALVVNKFKPLFYLWKKGDIMAYHAEEEPSFLARPQVGSPNPHIAPTGARKNKFPRNAYDQVYNFFGMTTDHCISVVYSPVYSAICLQPRSVHNYKLIARQNNIGLLKCNA